jgi:serine/threonine-protein kinase
MSPIATGSRVGSYELLEPIGRGGMGTIFRARHLTFGSFAAAKVINPENAQDPEFRTRFLNEATLAHPLEHPNIVRVIDAGEVGDSLYLVMALVEGYNLASVIGAGPLEPSRTFGILSGVASALDYAHERGLVHRDVKPDNVMLKVEPAAEHPYLTDFGIAKRVDAETRLTRTGMVIGSLPYLSRSHRFVFVEQATEDIDPANAWHLG